MFSSFFGLIGLALFAPLVAWTVDSLFAVTARLVWSNEERLAFSARAWIFR